MKRKSRGQSMVEFALVFPLLVILLFAAIDFGYYIFAWSETQFAARRAAEQATKMQPRQVLAATAYQSVSYVDPCADAIFAEAARSGALNAATSIKRSDVFITFYATTSSNVPVLVDNRATKAVGKVVQVRIYKELEPLTPLLASIVSGGKFKFNTFSRRTIVANGPAYPMVIPDGGTTNNYNNCTKY
jgi:Flp pilus assembly protein TadG